MSDTAIRVENLGKVYRIGAKKESYNTLRDSIASALMSPFKKAGSLLRGQAYGAAGLHEEIWALNDVSFAVTHGEVIGIIGHNGAGKSTLLKILSRITEPSSGYVDIYGRVGALLEVGTGFHQELTGRENIYLNGAILGMTRNDIAHKFDEIVDFSGIDRFLDTPVKHYSSGMRLRLGFAVAAHLEPEILVIDEVLAVGDAEFQKKCLGKMSSVAGEGRTVLFVSHNMAAVQNLCDRAIVLNRGQVTLDTDVNTAVTEYLSLQGAKESSWRSGTQHFNRYITVTNIEFIDVDGNSIASVPSGQDFDLTISYELTHNDSLENVRVGIACKDQMDVVLFAQTTQVKGVEFRSVPKKGQIICTLKRLPLPAGIYSIALTIKANEEKVLNLPDAVKLQVTDADFFGTGYTLQRSSGLFLVDADWQLRSLDS